MTFNDEQFASLQLYEQQMQTALRSNYGHIDSAKAKRVHEILEAAGITSPKMNYTCGWCVMRLLKLAGRYYFADKSEREMRYPLDYFVRKYEITYEEAKAAAERIGVEVVDGEVPAINSEDICQEIREHVLGLPGGFNADGLTLDEIRKAKAERAELAAVQATVEDAGTETASKAAKSAKESKTTKTAEK